MEALKLKRKDERSQLTRLINDIELTLSQDSVTEQQLCILNELLNHLHTGLTAADFDIVPLLSTTEAEAEFDGVADYNERATVTFVKLKYRIRQIHESLKRTSPSTSREPVQRMCTQQPGVHLPKIELTKFDGRPSMSPPFWEQFNQLIPSDEGLTEVDNFTYHS